MSRRAVDVVVAVRRGLEATRRCLESVLVHAQATPFDLVVVEDGVDEPELARWLSEQAQRRRITVLRQAGEGFASAVNRAQALHRERDVVILHNDAEVAGDWLDRLAFHAASAADIGTVAPFATRGGVADYPMNGARNELPEGYDIARLDALFREANTGLSAVVPLTSGPCIYVRRECFNATGVLEGGPLGSDYGVEQDFCLRAASAGYRHLLAGDVIVAHAGGLTFGDAAPALAEKAQAALFRLFPHYGAAREAFLDADPGRPFARRVDLLRLARSPRPRILFIAHGWGGGIRRHMEDLSALASPRCEVLWLEPSGGRGVRLEWHREGEAFVAYFRLPEEYATLVVLLDALELARIHVHHVRGLPREILDLPSMLRVPYDCTLHDYYTVCPQYHMVTEDGRYCGEPDVRGCNACLARRPAQWGLDITAWRTVFAHFLESADRIIAPSHDAAERVLRHIPGLAITVMPHPEALAAAGARVVRVVVPGNLSPEKGLHVVKACAEDAQRRNLPLTFRILGGTAEPLPQWPALPLSIAGQYPEDRLQELIQSERADVIFFPAQVPETYSYTLSVALASGLPIVASALGAFAERLQGYPRYALVPWQSAPQAWNDALLAACEPGEVPRRPLAVAS